MDTGFTLRYLLQTLAGRGPNSLSVCTAVFFCLVVCAEAAQASGPECPAYLPAGIVIRVFRAVVLTHGNASSSYLGASLVLGTLLLLGMATLHLGRFPVREWPWRAPLFAVFETAGEMLVSLVLIALHREPWGTARAEFTDWQPMATAVLFWRLVAVCFWALLLGGTVQFVRGRVLKDTGREVEPKTLPDGQPFIERRKRDEF